jgi:hypothetical protein
LFLLAELLSLLSILLLLVVVLLVLVVSVVSVVNFGFTATLGEDSHNMVVWIDDSTVIKRRTCVETLALSMGDSERAISLVLPLREKVKSAHRSRLPVPVQEHHHKKI